MSRHTIAMTDRLYEYACRTWLREPAVLQRLREETATLGKAAGMQISPEQGQFMAFLVELIGARRIIEVGTFTGYSALSMALALPADGQLVACDVSEEWTAVARRYWAEAGVSDRISLRLGPARETLDALLSQDKEASFDLGFIDADKTSYDDYYERLLRLLRPGGLILIDNVFRGGGVADPGVTDAGTQAIRDLNAKLRADERVSLAFSPIGDGLTLARRRTPLR